jgi:hypothetical protein
MSGLDAVGYGFGILLACIGIAIVIGGVYFKKKVTKS